MPPLDLKSRLDAAIRKRDQLAGQIQRVTGRLEEAERAREALREECRAKNIDPDKLDEAITKLGQVLESSLANFESKLDEATKAMEPFTTRK